LKKIGDCRLQIDELAIERLPIELAIGTFPIESVIGTLPIGLVITDRGLLSAGRQSSIGNPSIHNSSIHQSSIANPIGSRQSAICN
jgi:hypothetical protein